MVMPIGFGSYEMIVWCN